MANRLLFTFLSIAVMSVGMAYAGDQASPSGTQISSKQNDGKALAAMPDLGETPAPPASEIPIPYPNTSKATDTTKGSKEVKISDKEIQLKNKNNFKKSSGDEPGTQPPNIKRRSDTPRSTDRVKIKGRDVKLKDKDYLNDKSDQNPYP